LLRRPSNGRAGISVCALAQHQQDWYVRLNPRAVLPTLIDGDIVVPESNVINEYTITKVIPDLMSAIGPKQTWVGALRMSAFGGKADTTVALRDVR
jgi:glutathione S-transferase